MQMHSIRRFMSEHGLPLLLVLCLSFVTIVCNYWNPPNLFWDENYHIASAQKYLSGTFFMEPHPPLGKLMIALGEKLLNRNPDDTQFLGTDYGTQLPAGFSFAGYRLFPTVLAWLTAPLIFGIFLLITKRNVWALLLSFLYIFDNAMIVHNRSAMLESTLLFFSCLMILAFLLLLEWRDDRKGFTVASILFGAAFGAVMTTKLFGLILILLVPALFLILRPRYAQFMKFAWVSLLAFLIVFVGVWQIHFSLAKTINPALPDAGYYQASEQYKAILAAGKTWSPLAFPVMLKDSFDFVPHYQAGVPRLDLCKEDENGSPYFLWPVGGRSISYRWETPDGYSYRYLYLQVNPVVWFLGLFALIIGAGFLASHYLLGLEERLKHKQLLLTFMGMYLSYMAAISTIDRVMYLYHYFLPLIFSLIIVVIVFDELRQIGHTHLTEERKTGLLFTIALLIFLAFQFYRPLTYYEPLTDEQFQRRSLLPIWELQCVHCSKDSIFRPGPST